MFVVQLLIFEYEVFLVLFMVSVLMNLFILLNYKGLEEIFLLMINFFLIVNVQYLYMKGNCLIELVMLCFLIFLLGLYIFFKYLYFGLLFM